MTGWSLILILLILGGVLSTLGDRLGSRLGKARITIFNLRPKKTAVLITVLTGSLISALSLGFMLLVSRQLRVGLFELDALQTRIKSADNELQKLESNLIAFRRGDVVLGTGESIITATLRLQTPSQAKKVIDRLLQEANVSAYRRVRPRDNPNQQILLVPRNDINRLEQIISKKGTWVVTLRSAANVLSGEKFVYAFPEVRLSRTIFKQGEVLGRTTLQPNEISLESISKRIKLLLATTFAEAKRRGSLGTGLQFDASEINILAKSLVNRKKGEVSLESFALRNTFTADQVSIAIRVREKDLLFVE